VSSYVYLIIRNRQRELYAAARDAQPAGVTAPRGLWGRVSLSLNDREREQLAVRSGVLRALAVLQEVERCVAACRARGARQRGGPSAAVRTALADAQEWLTADQGPVSVNKAFKWCAEGWAVLSTGVCVCGGGAGEGLLATHQCLWVGDVRAWGCFAG